MLRIEMHFNDMIINNAFSTKINLVKKFHTFLITIGCNTDEDCPDNTDTCTAGQCRCGRKGKPCMNGKRCLSNGLESYGDCVHKSSSTA